VWKTLQKLLGVPSQETERSCICVLGVPSQETERSCICVLGVSILPLFPRNFDDRSVSWLGTPNTQIHDRSVSLLGTYTSI
jgi:hypothetical protein